MAGRRTNLALFGLIVIAMASGAVGFGTGAGWGRWAVITHGVAGAAIVLLAPWKSMIVRRGWRRHPGRPARQASALLSAAVLVTLISGVLHSTGLLVRAGSVTAMQIHVGAGLITIPLALAHVRSRPVKLRRPDWDRRNLLRAAGLAGGAALVYATIEGGMRLASLPGRDRRFTGSHERGSFEPASMPVTQWLDDSVQRIEPAGWKLSVTGSGRREQWTFDEIVGFDDRVTATLDCTGGWFSQQEWTGVQLDRLVAGFEGSSIVVRSTSGYSRRLPRSSAGELLLATSVGGAPLSAGHGFPARLVAPGRRGFWWVKWVEEIAVEDRPWWLQLPFPIT